MILQNKFQLPIRDFQVKLLTIFSLSLGLHFWGLERFDTLVFDEGYFVPFANNYLSHTPFVHNHPPLGKYLIAVSIWTSKYLHIGQDTAWSYRWLNALTGSIIPLVVAGIAYQLSHRRSYSFIAGLFATVDGLLLVESRYALINIYLVLFGLLGQWFFLIAIQGEKRWRLWLALAGVFFGASIAVKWNGLWFLLGAYLLWITAWIIYLVTKTYQLSKPLSSDSIVKSPLYHLVKIHPIDLLLNLCIIPGLAYQIAWIPHLQLNPGSNFWELQKRILSFHQHIGDNTHLYCSKWNSWLYMIRPVPYFYKKVNVGTTDPTLLNNHLLASTSGEKVIYDVHAMGNPILWWLSTLAIVFLMYSILEKFGFLFNSSDVTSTFTNARRIYHSTGLWIGLFLMVNYAANLLPWIKVSRCTFLYHYMGSSVFATLALAWLIDRLIQSRNTPNQIIGMLAVILILTGFLFWLPIYLGLPLSPEQFRMRMWLPTWI